MGGIGHNLGPTLEPGTSWRRHSWAKARARLLPVLPIEVVRLRVKRAQELGLDYRTYASIRATSGHDVIAFLFSSNALRVTDRHTQMPPPVIEKLAQVVNTRRCALVRGGVDAECLMASTVIDHAQPAPRPFAAWSEMRRGVWSALQGSAPDRVVLVGDTAEERDWATAARLAWYLPADRYFAA